MTSAFLGSDSVGRIIDGRFTLLRWSGGTEQSSVFLTELEGHPAKNAAIKFTPADAVDAETRIAQWAAAQTLSHPHLMRLFHAGRCNVDRVDLLYVVTEYAEEVLSEILRERPLTPGETREMLDPVLEALSWLHDRDLVHGHLTPSNIMVVDGRLKLSTDHLHAANDPGSVSPSSGEYAAPETELGQISPASDVWSLGVVLIEALAQQPPIWDRSAGTEPVVPQSIPPPFSAVARECLQVDPSRRPALSSVRDFLAGGQAPKPAGQITAAQPSRALPPRTQPPRARVVIVGTVLVVAGIVTTMFLRSHHRPSPPAIQSSAPPVQPASPGKTAQPPEASVVKGVVAYRATPDVPQSIRNTIQGHVKVRIGLQVDSSGGVANATIDSPGPSRYFANRALEAARGWKFTPASMDGRAVASKWILQFHFGQDGTTIVPTETSP
ncbi:MAG: TonB family protein [Acidobacteriaceae bacterium]